jgi:hypothetical protein
MAIQRHTSKANRRTGAGRRVTAEGVDKLLHGAMIHD